MARGPSTQSMDQHLRALERRAALSPVDGGRYLRELMRVGRLRPERLALAGHLGHEPSRIALDVTGPTCALNIGELAAFGREVLVRAAVVVAELALPAWCRVHPGAGTEYHYRRPLVAAKAWTDCPCPDHAREIAALTWSPPPWPFTKGAGLCGRFAASAAVADTETAERLVMTCIELGAESIGPGIVEDAIRRALVRWAVLA